MIFKKFRSLVGRLFSENMHMHIVIILSDIFWHLRKYFLSVEIDYPSEFISNWKRIKSNSSQDKERNFTIYQIYAFLRKLTYFLTKTIIYFIL